MPLPPAVGRAFIALVLIVVLLSAPLEIELGKQVKEGDAKPPFYP
jgi:hypothetical protein